MIINSTVIYKIPLKGLEYGTIGIVSYVGVLFYFNEKIKDDGLTSIFEVSPSKNLKPF